MTTRERKDRNKSSRVNPIAIFGSPPIIPGEDSSAYDELLLRATSALKPTDIIEEMFLNDIVRSTWDIIRLRRLQNALLNSAAHKGLMRVLEPLVERPAIPFRTLLDRIGHKQTFGWMSEELAERWRAQDPDAHKKVAALLEEAGLSMAEVMAEALSIKIADITAIDSLIFAAEERRNAALRELDRRRESFAQSARRFTHEIEATETKKLNGGDQATVLPTIKPSGQNAETEVSE